MKRQERYHERESQISIDTRKSNLSNWTCSSCHKTAKISDDLWIECEPAKCPYCGELTFHKIGLRSTK